MCFFPLSIIKRSVEIPLLPETKRCMHNGCLWKKRHTFHWMPAGDEKREEPGISGGSSSSSGRSFVRTPTPHLPRPLVRDFYPETLLAQRGEHVTSLSMRPVCMYVEVSGGKSTQLRSRHHFPLPPAVSGWCGRPSGCLTVFLVSWVSLL